MNLLVDRNFLTLGKIVFIITIVMIEKKELCQSVKRQLENNQYAPFDRTTVKYKFCLNENKGELFTLKKLYDSKD